MKPKTDKERRNKGDNKTCLLRVRCSEEEKNKDTKASGTDGQKALRVLSGGIAYGRDCCRSPIGRTRTGSYSGFATG